MQVNQGRREEEVEVEEEEEEEGKCLYYVYLGLLCLIYSLLHGWWHM